MRTKCSNDDKAIRRNLACSKSSTNGVVFIIIAAKWQGQNSAQGCMNLKNVFFFYSLMLPYLTTLYCLDLHSGSEGLSQLAV